MADGVGYPLAAVVKHDIGRGSTRAFSVGGTTRYFRRNSGACSLTELPFVSASSIPPFSSSFLDPYKRTVARTKQLEQSHPGTPGA